MGTVHKFRKPPKNRGQFRGYRPKPNGGQPNRPRGGRSIFAILRIAGAGLAIVLTSRSFQASAGDLFLCEAPQVTDGDTLRCGSRRVRLAGIDAPEMPGHCREGRDCAPGDPVASTENLKRFVGKGPLKCRQIDTDGYGSTVAECSKGGTDLSCQQIKDGQAIERYAPINC